MSTINSDRSNSRWQKTNWILTLHEWVVVAIVIVILIALLYPSVQRTGGGSSLRGTCRNNLQFIGLALHNYHEKYDSMPPAYVVDAEGKPLYSWRVLLLPYVDQHALYRKLHLDEPWDSPHNRPILNVDLPVFRCPTDKKAEAEEIDAPFVGMTNYLAVVGPETIWPAPEACRFDDVTDGLARTLAVVEVANSGIHWAEPRDLHVTQMSPSVNPTTGMGLSSGHTGGMYAVFGDGQVRFIPDNTPPETIRALLTRAGGEDVGDDF